MLQGRPPRSDRGPGARADLPRGYKIEDRHHPALVPCPITVAVRYTLSPLPALGVGQLGGRIHREVKIACVKDLVLGKPWRRGDFLLESILRR
jgi:hypothetical protein